MELRHLRYFVCVAEQLNFRRAASMLNISQPPLSMQIRDLEYELGCTLFVRQQRKVTLTDAGRLFLPKARAILQEAANAKRDVLLAKQGIVGRMSIRFMSSAVTGKLQDIVSRYKARFPDVLLDLEQSTVDIIRDDVRRGDIDIGVIRLPAYTPEDIEAVTIMKESYFVALPKGHALAKKKEISVRDMAQMGMVIYPRNTVSGSYDDIMELFASEGVVPNIVQTAVEQLTIAGLVATGMGYSIVPECMVHIKVPGVVHRPLKGGRNRTGMALIFRRDAGALIRNFVKIAA